MTKKAYQKLNRTTSTDQGSGSGHSHKCQKRLTRFNQVTDLYLENILLVIPAKRTHAEYPLH